MTLAGSGGSLSGVGPLLHWYYRLPRILSTISAACLEAPAWLGS
jgi:hypothetical protein